MPLCLHAITPADGPAEVTPAPDKPAQRPRLSGTLAIMGPEATRISFRELSAVVSMMPSFAPAQATPEFVAHHQAIVDAIFRRAAVLPAPVGVVFRAPDVLKRWMELHYVSLSGALEFVEDRAAARVHVVRADGRDEDLDAGSDLAAAATESFRAL